MVPQQVVRQIPPLAALSQGVSGAVSSAILFSAPAGAQGANSANMPRPGIVQVMKSFFLCRNLISGSEMETLMLLV